MKIPSFFKPARKRIVILIILIILTIIGVNAFAPKKQASLQFAQVKKQDIKSTISSSGNLTGKTVSNLKFKSSGKLAYINVSPGDKVFSGQVIAGLDTQDLSIKLQQAQNTLRDKQAIAEKAEDDVKDHSKDESFAQKVTRTTAQAARDSAFDALKEAQRAFQDAAIASPIAGLVTQAPINPGQVISASDLIAQVVDFSDVFFDSDIDEADIGKISLGQTSEVTLDAYPEKVFKGRINQIIPQTKTTSSGTTVITIKINLGTLDISLANGLSGQASIVLSEVKNTLTIPQEALREDNMVFIQTDKGLRSKKVEPGIKSDTDVEIKNGVSEHEKVLLNPPASGGVFNQNRNPLGGIFRLFGGGRER